LIKSKKSVHISINPDIHTAFKLQCIHRSLSMQEVFAAFADRVGVESNDMMRFLDQIVKDKQHKFVKKYTKSDVEAIYNMLEEEDPLKE
tara:strand:+ start:489 stop:755 length:267 start_codon:yes stop_codon:yes gene_type:complete